MKTAEQHFIINNPGSNKSRPHILTRRLKAVIPVGDEGKTTRETVISPRGDHGSYIFKEIYDEEQGQEEFQKWKYFQRHGVRVPELFKPVISGNGRHSLVITDLSNNGQYQVVSTNNLETKKDAFHALAQKISPTSRERIQTEMIYACEVAAGENDRDGENMEGIIYEFQTNAFMIAINPQNPDDINIYVADLGQDVVEINKQEYNPRSVLEDNLKSAAFFYTWMTGEPFQLPNNHPLAQKLNPRLADKSTDALRLSRWSHYKATHA